jgi:hypothetical protein
MNPCVHEDCFGFSKICQISNYILFELTVAINNLPLDLIPLTLSTDIMDLLYVEWIPNLGPNSLDEREATERLEGEEEKIKHFNALFYWST